MHYLWFIFFHFNQDLYHLEDKICAEILKVSSEMIWQIESSDSVLKIHLLRKINTSGFHKWLFFYIKALSHLSRLNTVKCIDIKRKVQWVLAGVCICETATIRPRMFLLPFAVNSHPYRDLRISMNRKCNKTKRNLPGIHHSQTTESLRKEKEFKRARDK